MNARLLLDTLEGLGVVASVTVSGKLRLEPASQLPAELLDEVRAAKSDLLAALTPSPDATPAEVVADQHNPAPDVRAAQVVTNLDNLSAPALPLRALAPLPEPLVRLVHAAKVNALNRPGFLMFGMVPNLGEYVLTCAALYACNADPERQLSDLWAARAAWVA